MKFIVQRVSEANVCVDNQIIGEIKKGFLVLVGVSNTDTKEIADKEASRRSKANYDLFELLDVKGNKSVYDIMRQYATDEPTKKFLNGGMIL